MLAGRGKFAQAAMAGLLLFIAALALALHIAACLMVALRRCWPRRAMSGESRRCQGARPGITLLCPLNAAGGGKEVGGAAGGAASARGQSLRAAFAEAWRPKEIILCADGLNLLDLSDIRAVREEHEALPSLLIMADERRPAKGQSSAAAGPGLAGALAKGFKAARYDRVAIAPLGALLPADYLARFLSREDRLRRRAAAGFAAGAAALICAPLWAVKPCGLKARLRAAFLNSWRARRLSLADSLGAGIAEMGANAGAPPEAAANAAAALAQSAALFSYDILSRAGGIDAFMRRAAEQGAAAAATELARAEGGKICLTARPLPLAAAQIAAGPLLAGELAWLRYYRRFLPGFFAAELLLSPLLPFLAMAGAGGLGAASLGALPVFIALWYGAEISFCALWGAGGSLLNYAFLPARDALLPFLWLAAALKK